MKKICHIVWASALLCVCLALLTFTAAAEAEFEMEIPYGKPTVDGDINEGEYGVRYVMDQATATAWVGEVGDSSVTWHLAWDEGGLYYAGTINDSTPSWRQKDHYWVGIDCLELAINPGLLLGGSSAEGVFFSFGSAEDGSIVAWRHNFADGLVSDTITGANTGHVPGTESYSMEVYIPWSLVQIKGRCTVEGKESIRLDSTDWEAKNGAQLGLLPCAIDSFDANGESIIAYKFNGTDFLAKDFVVATLVGGEESTEAPTELPADDPTEAPTTEATEPDTHPATDPNKENVTDVPTGERTEAEDRGTAATPDPKGCGATVALISLVLLPAAWIALRKREELFLP